MVELAPLPPAPCEVSLQASVPSCPWPPNVPLFADEKRFVPGVPAVPGTPSPPSILTRSKWIPVEPAIRTP
jgi:hypothetical protein